MKPYRKPHYKESAERDYLLSLCLAALVGGMVATIVTMGVLL